MTTPVCHREERPRVATWHCGYGSPSRFGKSEPGTLEDPAARWVQWPDCFVAHRLRRSAPRNDIRQPVIARSDRRSRRGNRIQEPFALGNGGARVSAEFCARCARESDCRVAHRPGGRRAPRNDTLGRMSSPEPMPHQGMTVLAMTLRTNMIHGAVGPAPCCMLAGGWAGPERLNPERPAPYLPLTRSAAEPARSTQPGTTLEDHGTGTTQ